MTPLRVGQLSVTRKSITTVSAGKLLCDNVMPAKEQHDKISKSCDRTEKLF